MKINNAVLSKSNDNESTLVIDTVIDGKTIETKNCTINNSINVQKLNIKQLQSINSNGLLYLPVQMTKNCNFVNQLRSVTEQKLRNASINNDQYYIVPNIDNNSTVACYEDGLKYSTVVDGIRYIKLIANDSSTSKQLYYTTNLTGYCTLFYITAITNDGIFTKYRLTPATIVAIDDITINFVFTYGRLNVSNSSVTGTTSTRTHSLTCRGTTWKYDNNDISNYIDIDPDLDDRRGNYWSLLGIVATISENKQYIQICGGEYGFNN